MNQIYVIESVKQMHEFLGLEKPQNSLISIIPNKIFRGMKLGNIRFYSELYTIALKENIKGLCLYGRTNYDFEDGTLLFIAPGQIMSSSSEIEENIDGFTILFHPDLIRSFDLAYYIGSYDFFSYEINEALHLSAEEKEVIKTIVANIEKELDQELDELALELIVGNLKLIMKYSVRFYTRQFSTRCMQVTSVVTNLNNFLNHYFTTNQQLKDGIPTLESCGRAMNMSGKYLSNILKNETGKSLIEHIHAFLIERAKNNLLNSSLSVSELAYHLGFKYHQHFSSFFKKNTGFSPKEFRNGIPILKEQKRQQMA